MILNEHSELRGKHAMFSPSQPSWLNYDEEKIVERMINYYRAPLGTEIHEFCEGRIRRKRRINKSAKVYQLVEDFIFTKYTYLNDGAQFEYGLKLIEHLDCIPDETWLTVQSYVNDAISYRMIPEQPVKFNDKVFGTADAFTFKNNTLRIHDLKTGSGPVHIEQLRTYAAIFCLEYSIKPGDINMELRIYQLGEVLIDTPTVADIAPIMDQIITVGKLSNKINRGQEG